jgi:rare lipoprotein A
MAHPVANMLRQTYFPLISALTILVGAGALGGLSARRQASPVQAKLGWRQLTQADSAIWYDTRIGKASWYGPMLDGRLTASGEKFDQTALTAAYSVPFGTVLRVTNLKNNQSVIVRVNDRHPAQNRAIIDISKAAAQKINSIQAGVVPVKIEVLPSSSDAQLVKN